jgi:hypothetical protein
MTEQPREAVIYIFGYRGLDLPLEKDMPAPAPEARSLAELFDRWTSECWQVLPTSKGVGIVVRTRTASNRINHGGTGPVRTRHIRLDDYPGDHVIEGFDPRSDQLLVYGVKNARLEEDSTARAVKVHLPGGRVITLALRKSS